VRWGVALPQPARPWWQRVLYIARLAFGRLPTFLRRLLYRLWQALPSRRDEE